MGTNERVGALDHCHSLVLLIEIWPPLLIGFQSLSDETAEQGHHE
jgi:hypothetical protein